MDRAVWLAAATWVGGVGAWGVGIGYTLARGSDSAQQNTRARSPLSSRGQRIQLDGSGDEAPTPPPAVVDLASLPAPPLPLDAPASEGASSRSASFDSSRTFDSLNEMEEFLLRREAKVQLDAKLVESDGDVDDFNEDDDVIVDEDSIAAQRAANMAKRAAAEKFDVDLVPPDASGLMTESQRRRLAPIKPLKRTRRSRKVRVTGPTDDQFVPLVKGARPSQDEAILAAYNGDTLDVKREQGEDYWVDPKLLEHEIKAKEETNKRREEFKLREKPFVEDRLKKEIAAPYKNNLISVIVVGIGIISCVFAAFPSLLELNAPASIASFPSEL